MAILVWTVAYIVGAMVHIKVSALITYTYSRVG